MVIICLEIGPFLVPIMAIDEDNHVETVDADFELVQDPPNNVPLLS